MARCTCSILLGLFLAIHGLGTALGAQGLRGLERVVRENGTVVVSFPWQDRRVVFEDLANEGWADTCRILDRHGAVIRVIHAGRFLVPSPSDPREAFLKDLDGDGLDELHVVAWSGGAYGRYVDGLFRGSDARNLLVYPGGEGRIGKEDTSQPELPFSRLAGEGSKDLDGDGSLELILADHGIHTAAGGTHGPTTALVLARRGSRYVDATRRFPALAREKAKAYRNAIAFSEPRLIDLALSEAMLGYLANATLAGDGAEARAWLLVQRGQAVRDWLVEFDPVLRTLAKERSRRIRQAHGQRIWLR